MIYFLRSPEGPIKIGTTIRLSERLPQLEKECGSTLELLGVIDGSYGEESALHRKFSNLCVFREWFDPGEELLDFIENESKPWDGRDEAEVMGAVKFDRTLADKAKLVASRNRTTLSRYLSDISRELIERDFARAVEEMR